MPTKKPDDPLGPYRAKRTPQNTPEPWTGDGLSRPRQFVVQKHAARRTHYDLRLEWADTLWSWAVPNGFSLNPADKKLAVHTEDHPVEYTDFEGVIPKDNYGAGAMIVWDRGVWVPLVDPEEGLKTGKIHFELRGFKLHGEWELIRPRAKDGKTADEWLLFKKKDAWASTAGAPFDERSILSGLTVEELGQGLDRTSGLKERVEELGAPRRAVDPNDVGLMLAETVREPFSHPDWIFELKYDGFRLLASKRVNGSPCLLYRSGMDVSWLFPELARTLQSVPLKSVILDGEVVVLDEKGRPDFQRLQKRAQLKRKGDIEPATVTHPATLFVFDLLAVDDHDLRPLPLHERKALLKELLPGTGAIRYADHVDEAGEALYEKISALGLEGVVAKKKDTPYKAGRSPAWLKVVADQVGDFAVCGFSEPKGARTGLGALHLAFHTGTGFVYAGRVGTGFSEKLLTDLRNEMEPFKTTAPKDVGPFPRSRGNWWVPPTRVVQVRFKTWTEEGLLRLPVFMRLRDDKDVTECRRVDVEPPPELEIAMSEDTPRSQAAPPETPEVTRPEKIFWPRERYTKGDLVEYYRLVSPWLLPYLEDRPLVLTRYPDGIEGKSFYQKNAPEYVPDWVETTIIWSESAGKDIEYFVCNSAEMLLYLVNLATIPLHVWPSRVTDIGKPDWSIIDLDPKEAPFAHVVTLARAARELCEDISLPAYVKTSGSSGLHILVPLGGLCNFEQSRMLAHLVSLVLEQENKDIATTTRTISARGGKVYLDFLQNRHGQLLVAPYSVRPLPGAPVSTPLEWNEVNDTLDPRAFTIKTLPERLRKWKRDPVRAVLTEKADLGTALVRLEARLRK